MISVAMCTYNGAKYLRRQLESLATQSLSPLELQVGDDRSTDDTVAILKDFSRHAPFPVSITLNEKSLGYGNNFIRTASRCHGQWIAFCDQDDIWLPQKLERCAEIIGSPDVFLVVHNHQLIDEQGVKGAIARTWPALSYCPRLSLWPGHFDLGLCQVFHRDLIHKIPAHDRHMPWVGVPNAHDAWISFLASAIGTTARIGEPLVLYRQHSNNASSFIDDAEKPFWGDGTAGTYTAIASALGSMSNVLEQVKLPDASLHYQRVAKRYETRARVYTGPKRLASFFELLKSGCYRSGGYSNFGRRAVVADLRAAIARIPISYAAIDLAKRRSPIPSNATRKRS